MSLISFSVESDELLTEYISDPAKFTSINPTRISEELVKQPALYARFATLLTEAKRNTQTYKLATEVIYAQLYSTFRKDSNAEKTCEQLAKSHVDYRTAKQKHIDAEYAENVVRSAVDALEQRKDMLISVTTLLRQEMITHIRAIEDQSRTFIGKGGTQN